MWLWAGDSTHCDSRGLSADQQATAWTTTSAVTLTPWLLAPRGAWQRSRSQSGPNPWEQELALAGIRSSVQLAALVCGCLGPSSHAKVQQPGALLSRMGRSRCLGTFKSMPLRQQPTAAMQVTALCDARLKYTACVQDGPDGPAGGGLSAPGEGKAGT